MKIVSKIGIAIILLLLVIACGVLYLRYDKEQQKNSELHEALSELAKKEQQSAVMQSINAQMEEIATQQREISDAQRKEALQQTILANEQRHQAEIERQNAQIAEKKAIEASLVAKTQRQIADQQRLEAETSKKVADTLSYINLGRSLGTVAKNQFAIGNNELGNLLSYAAFTFTKRYRGDQYTPSVYQALTSATQSNRVWSKHKGRVTDIDFFTDNQLVTVSTYGEIIEHTLENENLSSKVIFSDKNFDFRHLAIHKTSLYAVSRSGHLVIKNPKEPKVKIIPLTEVLHPQAITSIGDQLLIAGERAIALIDPKSNTVVQTRQLSFNIVFMTRYDYSPVLFDDKGNMHVVRTIGNIETKRLPVKGQITAFASSKNTGTIAYGMKDGIIYFDDGNGKLVKLEGHRSQVSFIKINGKRLYSSSYDGTIKLWMTGMAKLEPIDLLSIHNWIIYFTFDKKKNNIWTANQNGSITESHISVPLMERKLRSLIKRDLTQSEWNYYVGKNVPYESLLGKEELP